MTRTNIVQNAKKAHGNCRVCGKPINEGDSYKWAKPNYGAKVVVCSACTITPRMTSSSKMVTIWQEQEGLDQNDPEAIRSLASTAREVGEEYQESCDNQREFFPDSEVAQENEEKAEGLGTWADELESAADSLETALEEVDSAVGNCPE